MKSNHRQNWTTSSIIIKGKAEDRDVRNTCDRKQKLMFISSGLTVIS